MLSRKIPKRLLRVSAVEKVFIAILFLCSVSSTAQAWGPHGHAAVAAVAWELMSEEAKQSSVLEIRNHKRFKEIFMNRMPSDVRRANQRTKDKWLFLQAGLAPDTAKDLDDDPDQDHFHKSKWHYISYPEYLDPSDENLVNPSDSLSTDIGRCGLFEHWRVKNAVQALKMAECVVRNSRWVSRRGKYLTWLVHLSGDAHQPLHAAKLFTPKLFNKGDRGGGKIIVTYDGRSRNLHSLWDGFPGRAGRNFSFIFSSVESDVESYFGSDWLVKAGKAAARTDNFETWFKESNQLAVDKAYGPLKSKLIDAEKNNSAKIGMVSDSYVREGECISKRRVMEAGYRLATILNDIYRISSVEESIGVSSP